LRGNLLLNKDRRILCITEYSDEVIELRYMKPETENALGCLSAFFWPLGLVMAVFGLIFREKHPSPYADPRLAKERKGKRATKPPDGNKDIDPWDLPSEKAPWEK